MKNKLIISRILCMLLVCSLLVSVTFVPVSAADPELYYQDILLDAVYSCYEETKLISSTKQTPTHFFSGITNCSFLWDARTYDRTYSSIIYTVFFSVDPGIDNVRSFFHHYDGRVTEASVTQLDTYYYQFRIDRTSNMAWPRIEFEFVESAYSGTISLLSCYGIRDIGTNIDKVNFQQAAKMIKTGTAVLVNEPVLSVADQPLPVGHMSKRTDQYQTWYNDIVFVTGDFSGASYLDSLTFIGYGLTPDLITFTLLDSRGWPIYAPDFDDIGAKISTSIGSWGDHAWDVVFWQIDIDLSGYDLEDCTWELSFQIEPMPYKSGMSFTDWNLDKVIARLPVENTPWYKTFFSWLSVKWDNVTSSIVTEIKNVGKKLDNIVISPSVQEHLNDAAGEMDSKKEQINEYNDRFQELEKPEISGSSLIDPILPGNALGLTVMTTLANQDIIARLILAVFSFSLMGYVMFGKR